MLRWLLAFLAQLLLTAGAGAAAEGVGRNPNTVLYPDPSGNGIVGEPVFATQPATSLGST